MKIVSVINHKGGVGKTTFAGSVAQALALCGFRVLAIDNDSQHNLSTMLGTGVQKPGLRDVYRAGAVEAPRVLLASIRTSAVAGLHVITSDAGLIAADVVDRMYLRDCFKVCDLARFYDYVIIDNAPGLDTLQICAMYAADELFVPTALGQFAVDGVVEMDQILRTTYPDAAGITRIIPNFYKDSKRQNSYIAALNHLFPGRVTKTALPIDSVFDELVTENKILFLHRLSSKGAAYYLKIVHELFDFNEEELWVTMREKQRRRMNQEGRDRLRAWQQNERKAAL